MLRINLAASLLAALFISSGVAAADGGVSPEVVERLTQKLSTVLPNMTPDSVVNTPVKGMYEVMFGARLFYVSEDARYLIQGSMIDLERRENLTEPRIAQAKVKAVADIGEENMLIYGLPEAKHTVTVFTDIDCGYCRKLHSEMEQINANDIRIRYLLYPRAGKNSESYLKAVSAWCADDPKTALTTAKLGNPIPNRTCENPVDEHMELGRMFGLQGTPALILDDGEMIPGYVPADRLKLMLDQRQKTAAK